MLSQIKKNEVNARGAHAKTMEDTILTISPKAAPCRA
jgi:hypothetical protein